jgi:hypothetical protein
MRLQHGKMSGRPHTLAILIYALFTERYVWMCPKDGAKGLELPCDFLPAFELAAFDVRLILSLA